MKSFFIVFTLYFSQVTILMTDIVKKWYRDDFLILKLWLTNMLL